MKKIIIIAVFVFIGCSKESDCYRCKTIAKYSASSTQHIDLKDDIHCGITRDDADAIERYNESTIKREPYTVFSTCTLY